MKSATPLCCLALLPVFLSSPSLLAQRRPSDTFVAIPGKRAFSGFVTARPIQAGESVARGYSERKFRQLRVEAARAMTGFGIRRSNPEVDEYVIPVPAGQTEEAVAGRLMETGAFSYVEPDWLVYPVNCTDDPLIGNQWHHRADRLDSCGAWAVTTGSPSVVVAICDTGIRTTHADLQLHRQEGYHVPSRLWESEGGAILDIQGHGTLCTGSAAANGNNGLGLSGIGWNLGHRMLRVTDSSDGSASLSDLTLAARVAADAGDKVVSVSYSGVNNASVFSTGTYVRSKGALLIWAAGNENANLTGNREDDVIVVGATDSNDARAYFSNYGGLVDLVAPGVSVATTSNSGDAKYSAVSGTSFSAPIVAGLCGLIWSRNPDLTPVEVERILRTTSEDLGAAGVDSVFGYGRVDAAAALAATPEPGLDTVPPAVPTGLVAVAGDAEVRLSWDPSPEIDLAGYSVWRSMDAVHYEELTPDLVTSPGFVDAGLENGVTYHYAVRAEDLSGHESVDAALVTATPVAPPPVTDLLVDGFDAGVFGNGWKRQNTYTLVSAAALYEGTHGLRLQRSTWAERVVSTVGYENIIVSYARRTIGLGSSQWLFVEWWDGSRWTTIESVRSNVYNRVTFALPASAANLSAFKLRFRLHGRNATHQANVDSVVMTGTRQGGLGVATRR